MSSFGPAGLAGKRQFACLACQDEIPHRLGGTSFSMRYPMRGPICKHVWPPFARYLPRCTRNLIQADRVQRWKLVKTRGVKP